ncbi:MAG: N-acetylmuramoyl-L-alanine amidase-like domain-containing protein, partial [Gammaproteobacteria bacterium]
YNFKLLSYEHGQVTFLARNHFVADDWNVNNANSGFIKDITTTIKDPNGQSPVVYAVTTIDKPNWYRMMLPQRVRVFFYPGDMQAQQLLNALRAQASQVKSQRVSTPYIPLTALFNAAGQPNMQLFNQIPSGTVIEIVRPNWDLTKLIGTHLNVSHIGFAIKTPQGLMFRQASFDSNKVTQLPLTAYLHEFIGTEVQGINLQQTL